MGGAVGFRHNSSDDPLVASAAINPFFGLQAAGAGVNLVNLATPVALSSGASVDNDAVFGRIEAGVELLTLDGIGLSVGASVGFEGGGDVESAAFVGASVRF